MRKKIKITIFLSLLFFLADCNADPNSNYQMTEADGQIIQDIYKLCRIEYPVDVKEIGKATDCFVTIRNLANIESNRLKEEFQHPRPVSPLPVPTDYTDSNIPDYTNPNIPCSEFDNYPIPKTTLDFSEGRPALAKDIYRMEVYQEFEKNIKRNRQCGYTFCRHRKSQGCKYKQVELEIKLERYYNKLLNTDFSVNTNPIKGCEDQAAILSNLLSKNIADYLPRQIKEYKDCLIRHK